MFKDFYFISIIVATISFFCVTEMSRNTMLFEPHLLDWVKKTPENSVFLAFTAAVLCPVLNIFFILLTFFCVIHRDTWRWLLKKFNEMFGVVH